MEKMKKWKKWKKWRNGKNGENGKNEKIGENGKNGKNENKFQTMEWTFCVLWENVLLFTMINLKGHSNLPCQLNGTKKSLNIYKTLALKIVSFQFFWAAQLHTRWLSLFWFDSFYNWVDRMENDDVFISRSLTQRPVMRLLSVQICCHSVWS